MGEKSPEEYEIDSMGNTDKSLPRIELSSINISTIQHEPTDRTATHLNSKEEVIYV